MFDLKTKENIAVAAVHSFLLLASATAIAYFTEPIEKTRRDPREGSFLAAAPLTNCPGTKLNYPRVIEEDLPNGQRTSFRYNCVQSGFWVTSYDGNCKGCSGRTHFTNEPVTWGVCAVDQNVIPPHSTFYVPGYGPCKAADKGGLVKGKKIDVGFSNIREGWWSRRYTEILTLVE